MSRPIPVDHDGPIPFKSPLPVSLIYPEAGGVYKHLLLIDGRVRDSARVAAAANADTFPITYFPHADRADVLAVLGRTFTAIDRIAVFCEGETPAFLNREPFFAPGDPSAATANALFVDGVVREFGAKNIDFLACNSLQSPAWVAYYAARTAATGVVVGASADATGNIKYGGDWVMESTHQDIELIYFTAGIEYYTYLLDPPALNFSVGGIGYHIIPETDNVSIVAFPSGPVTIPVTATDTVTPNKTYNVVSIDPGAHNIAGITNLTISAGTSSVPFVLDVRAMFYKCASLATVTFAANCNVTVSGDDMFRACANLATVTFAANCNVNVTASGDYMFYNCANLATVTFAANCKVTASGNRMFYYCANLATVTFAGGCDVTVGGAFMFYGCAKLEAVTFAGGWDVSAGRDALVYD